MRPPIWQLVREAVHRLGGEATYTDIKQAVWKLYPDIKSATLTCQIIVCSVNHRSRIHYPENKRSRICSSQYDFLFSTGRGKVVLYDVDKHGQWEIVEDNGVPSVQIMQEGTTETLLPAEIADDQGGSFALESHLRDYLAKHLPSLDDGSILLKLYESPDGRDGVEFQTDVGPIDILATSAAGDFYVLELKLGKGPDVALGQILRYMGWVEQHICEGKKVFGVIIASDMTTKLKYAATQVPQVRLMEYELKVSLKPAQL